MPKFSASLPKLAPQYFYEKQSTYHTLHTRFDRIDSDRAGIDDHSLEPKIIIKLGRSCHGLYASGDIGRGRPAFTCDLQF